MWATAQRAGESARRNAGVVRRLVNPARLGYGCAGLMGLWLFCWLFVSLRFDSHWNYHGWLWHGYWPVLAMLAGATLAAVGVIGVRRWDNTRWRRRAGAG